MIRYMAWAAVVGALIAAGGLYATISSPWRSSMAAWLVPSERVAEAIQLCPTDVKIQKGNAADLQMSDQSFDVVLQSTVFTSVLDSNTKQRMASEMLRVVKQNGLILWYDYHMNNPKNPDVRGVKMREIKRLFPDCDIRLQRITLAPPIARLLAPYSWLLCYFLSRIPWLCSHYIGVIRKNSVLAS